VASRVRVPAIITSPYVERRFVDHTTYETVSILKFIGKSAVPVDEADHVGEVIAKTRSKLRLQ
jgi:hypothetical protein